MLGMDGTLRWFHPMGRSEAVKPLPWSPILVRARGRHWGPLLKHEMLHAILYSGDHHDQAWLLGGHCGFDGRG